MQEKKDKENNLKVKKDRTYMKYTMLFCIISFIVFFAFIKYNKSFVWQVDGIKQHFAILYDFNQMIRNMFQKRNIYAILEYGSRFRCNRTIFILCNR